MDPVSITASVVALTRTVFLCARDLQSLHTRFSSSSRIITSISTESKLIGAFLQQLGKLLKNSPRAILERIEDSPELGDALKAALDHCTDIYQQLNKEISYFKENHKKPGQLRFRDKLRYLWNEENLKELHQTLRAQQGIFSSFLQLNSAVDIMEIKQGLHLLRENVAPGKGLCSEQPPLPDPPTQLVHERLNRSFEKEFPSNGSLQLKIRQKEIVHHTSDLLDDDDDNDDDIEASDAGDDSSSLRAASLEVLAPHSAPSSPLSGAEEDHITGDWDLQRPYSSGSASLATDSRASRLPPETRTRKHISSKPLILDPDVAFSLLG